MTTAAALKAAATRRARKATLVVYSKTMTRTDMVAEELRRKGYPPIRVLQASEDKPGRVVVSQGLSVNVPANGSVTLVRMDGCKPVATLLGEKTTGLLDAIDFNLFAQLLKA